MSRISQSTSRQSLLAERARLMRREPTFEERLLWQELRRRRLGIAFRRQVPIAGRYIVDFLAPKARLVFEVDGGYHAERVKADARRDAALERLGYRVLRLEAELVAQNVAVALGHVCTALGVVGAANSHGTADQGRLR